MSCGDTLAQWVDPATGSVWAGTADALGTPRAVTVAALPNGAATATVDGWALTGVWNFGLIADQLVATVGSGGITYQIQVAATTCASGSVTVADGTLGDTFGQGVSLTLARVA